jgi:hypothetical protein
MRQRELDQKQHAPGGRPGADNQRGQRHKKDGNMVLKQSALFNSKKSIPFENIPDLDALRGIWRSLDTEEASTPVGCRLGVALRRQELLAVFPAWQIPEIIDALNQEEAVFV